MTNTQKTVLFWLGAALMVVLSIFLLASTNQEINTAATTNTVTFTGDGKVTAKADVAVAYLSIVTEAATSKAAQDQNSEKSQKVIDFLKTKNVKQEDIKTTGYNIYPQYSYPQYDSPKIKGYQVNESVEVKIRNLDDVSEILDGVVTAGVNQVNSLSFQIDDPEKLKDQAREMAINNAKGKADTLKNQLGIKLGRIINFTEGVQGYPVPLAYDVSAMGATGRGGAGPAVETGQNEITVTVTVTYQIK